MLFSITCFQIQFYWITKGLIFTTLQGALIFVIKSYTNYKLTEFTIYFLAKSKVTYWIFLESRINDEFY